MKVQKTLVFIILFFCLLTIVHAKIIGGNNYQWSGTLINNATKLTIPTYDGSGQAVHPDVYYNSSGWNGYKYWMAMTPFYNSDDDYENPSILVSNNSIDWIVPPGLTNPIDSNPGNPKHNADTSITFKNNQLYVFYQEIVNSNYNVMKFRNSSDGITWSSEYTADNYSDQRTTAPSVRWNESDNLFYIWSTNYSNPSVYSGIELRNSTNGINLSEPQNVIFTPSLLATPWHIHVEYVPEFSEYWMTIASTEFDESDTSLPTKLFFAKSTDRIHFTLRPQPLLVVNTSNWDSLKMYTTAILYNNTEQKVKIWYSATTSVTPQTWWMSYLETTTDFLNFSINLNGSRVTGDNSLANNLNSSYLNGLLAYYSADETTGTIWHNVNTESGFPNTTYQGTWHDGSKTLNLTQLNYTTNCRIGNCGLFDGVNDYVITTPNIAERINQTGAYSIGGWFNATNVKNTQFIVGINNGSNTITVMLQGGVLRAKFYNGTAAFGTKSSSTLTLLNYTWYHFIYTYNNTIGTLYINNAIQSGSSVATNSIANNNFLIGVQRSDTFLFPFGGSIDEIKIWERNLSASEVAVEYNNSMRSSSMPVIFNQTASVNNVINRTRIVYSGQDSSDNISIDARQNNTISWSLIQSNVITNTWYNISSKFYNTDFNVEMNSNGSLSPFLSSLEWDENVPDSYIPPIPINITNITGNFYVNTTWQAGSGNITTSYNVSVNGAWTNGSANTFANSTLSVHAWQNVSVYAFNSSGTGTINATPVSQNTQVTNNPIIISNISDNYTLGTGGVLSIYPNSSDPDGDTATFARNFTNGTFYTNNGTLLWTTTTNDAGNHYWQINVSDGYDSVSTINFTVTVTTTTIPETSIESAIDSKSTGAGGFTYSTDPTPTPLVIIPIEQQKELYEQFIPSISPYQIKHPLEIGIYSIQFKKSCTLPIFMNRTDNNIFVISQCSSDSFLINFIVPKKNIELVSVTGKTVKNSVFQLINNQWIKSDQQIVGISTDNKYYIIQVSPNGFGVFTFKEIPEQKSSIKDTVLYIDSVLYNKLMTTIQIISNTDLKSIDNVLYDKLLKNIQSVIK